MCTEVYITQYNNANKRLLIELLPEAQERIREQKRQLRSKLIEKSIKLFTDTEGNIYTEGQYNSLHINSVLQW